MTDATTLEDVRAYWNEFVNDIEVTDLPVGSPEFFDALERYRYEKIDYLRDYVGFSKYKGKKVLEIGCGVGIDLLQFARSGSDVSAGRSHPKRDPAGHREPGTRRVPRRPPRR